MWLDLFSVPLLLQLLCLLFDLKIDAGWGKKKIFCFNYCYEALDAPASQQVYSYHESHSQSEDLVPLWVEVFVDGVCLQPIIAQLHHAERVALTCDAYENYQWRQTLTQPKWNFGWLDV